MWKRPEPPSKVQLARNSGLYDHFSVRRRLVWRSLTAAVKKNLFRKLQRLMANSGGITCYTFLKQNFMKILNKLGHKTHEIEEI